MAEVHRCTQCGRDMGFEWIMGPVCGACCRANHARVMGKAAPRRKRKAKRR